MSIVGKIQCCGKLGMSLCHDCPDRFGRRLSPAPDFEALRAKRNKSVREMIAKVAKEHGFDMAEVKCNHNDNACYCACPDGPCEHKWDGEVYESDDGCSKSYTCSRCGCTAMGHDMRVGP